MAVIVTDRLILRRADPADLDDLHRVFSDPKAMRYWDSLPYDHQDKTQALLTAMVQAQPGQSDDFVVCYQDRVIGKAGCWRVGEIGIILHSDHWGQGLAYEALSNTIPHSFAHLEMDKILADVDPRNTASLRLMARLGFVETARKARTIKVGDEWCDSVFLELPRPDQ